jgi:hypothetical protein
MITETNGAIGASAFDIFKNANRLTAKARGSNQGRPASESSNDTTEIGGITTSQDSEALSISDRLVVTAPGRPWSNIEFCGAFAGFGHLIPRTLGRSTPLFASRLGAVRVHTTAFEEGRKPWMLIRVRMGLSKLRLTAST